MCVCVCVCVKVHIGVQLIINGGLSFWFSGIAIKESAHVGDATQKRLVKGVDDLGEGVGNGKEEKGEGV